MGVFNICQQIRDIFFDALDDDLLWPAAATALLKMGIRHEKIRERLVWAMNNNRQAEAMWTIRQTGYMPPDFLPVLHKLLLSPFDRLLVIKTLKIVGNRESCSFLRQVVQTESNPAIKAEAIDAIRILGGRNIEDINAIITAFEQDPNHMVKVYAASALASLGIAPEAISQVIETLHERSDNLLIATQELIKLGRSGEAYPILRHILDSWRRYPYEMVACAMKQACQLGPSYVAEVTDILRCLVENGDDKIKVDAIYSLANLQAGDPQTVSLLRGILKSEKPYLREPALYALLISGKATANDVAILEEMIKEDSACFRSVLRGVPRDALSDDVVRAIEKMCDDYPSLITPETQAVLFHLGIVRKGDPNILLQQYQHSVYKSQRVSILAALEELWFALGCQPG